jgi:hypothetical protein
MLARSALLLRVLIAGTRQMTESLQMRGIDDDRRRQYRDRPAPTGQTSPDAALVVAPVNSSGFMQPAGVVRAGRAG